MHELLKSLVEKFSDEVLFMFVLIVGGLISIYIAGNKGWVKDSLSKDIVISLKLWE